MTTPAAILSNADADDATWASARRRVMVAAAVCLLLRLLLALVSVGTNDVAIWMKFATQAANEGFLSVWPSTELMNHPPLPVAWSLAAFHLSGGTEQAFSIWLKLPGILAEVGSTWFVGRIVARRAGATAGALAAMLYAINPAAILVSGYHGNTDAVLAFLTLLAWHLADRGRLLLAGLALAASINVKVSPLPSVLVLFACARSHRDVTQLLGGLAAGLTPFAMMAALVGEPFVRHVFLYRPMYLSWIADALWLGRGLPVVGGALDALARAQFASLAYGVVAIAIACAALRRRWPDRFPAIVIGGIYWSCFLAWSGSAFQYTIWPIPLLAALRPRLTLVCGVAAGVYLLVAYYDGWLGSWPLMSLYFPGVPYRYHNVTALPALALLAIAASLLRDRSRAAAPERTVDA